MGFVDMTAAPKAKCQRVFVLALCLVTGREMYCGHSRLCVVSLSAASCLHYCTDPDVTWGMVGDGP